MSLKIEFGVLCLTILWIGSRSAPENCTHDIFSYSGYIQTLNFPNPYPSGRNCTWTISTISVYKLQLLFETFDLEDHESCKYDHIIVYDGADVNDRILGKFCGNTIPEPLLSSKNVLTIKFHSDARVQGTGFKASYTSAMCGASFQQETGTFDSPSYPNNYPGYKGCMWVIETTKDKQISLTIDSLQLDNFSNCSLEYITIRSGSENFTQSSGIHLTTICKKDGMHEQNPSLNDIRSLSNKMYVSFFSAASIQGFRFSAVFKTVPCGGKFKKDEGILASPNYPANYPDNTACIWTIIVSDGYQVALNFTSFDIWYTTNCTEDFLEIRDGSNATSPLIMDPLCGYDLPDVIHSSSNTMWVRFKSDSSFNEKGFIAAFGKDIDECSENTTNCQQGCQNFIGSYECFCNDGFILDEDKHTCLDIDECEEGLHICEHECENTDGSYKCHCMNGYTLNSDNRTCSDVDECAEQSSKCEHECKNTAGSYFCRCHDGYELQNDRHSCADVNECAEQSSKCEHKCMNTAGSYICRCYDGYALQNDRRSCAGYFG